MMACKKNSKKEQEIEKTGSEDTHPCANKIKPRINNLWT